MIKRIVVCFCLILLFSYNVFADNISLYNSIDDSSSQCNLLIDAMRNDPNYDPYNEYCVVRAGERDYRIYFGKSLSGADLTFYRFNSSYQGIPASLSRGTASNLSIQTNGYYYVGNVEGTLAAASAEDYKLGIVVTISAVFVLILILFRMFRKSEGNKAHYYKVR